MILAINNYYLFIFISSVRKEDEGQYECQVSMVKKLSMFVDLTVLGKTTDNTIIHLYPLEMIFTFYTQILDYTNDVSMKTNAFQGARVILTKFPHIPTRLPLVVLTD